MNDCVICARHRPTPEGDCTPRCRHRAADQGRLCAPCVQRIRDDLDAIVAAMNCPPPTHGPGAGTGERALPGGTEWLDMRQGAELRGWLHSWCRVWHEDATTDDTSPAWPAVHIVAMSAWLRVMLETVGVQHEAIAEFAQELRDWASRARRLTGDIPSGHIVPCPCGRRLRVEAHDMDAEVTCRSCGTRWSARSLVINAGDDDAWLDWQAIEEYLGVPRRTLFRWASVGRVERQHGLFRVGSVKAAARSA